MESYVEECDWIPGKEYVSPKEVEYSSVDSIPKSHLLGIKTCLSLCEESKDETLPNQPEDTETDLVHSSHARLLDYTMLKTDLAHPHGFVQEPKDETISIHPDDPQTVC